ncbi:MAG: DUF4330 family protein [Oscillospiraceae bacterium]|jgi:hypothetical protein
MKHRKWNIVDLLIIVVVVVLLIFGGVKLLGREDGSANASMKQLTYTVKVSGIEKASYASIQNYVPGDLMASGARVDGNITKAESEPSVIYVNLNSNGPTPALLPVQSNDLVDVVFTIEANVEADGVLTSKVGTQEVRIGKTHIVKTEHIELTGTVLTVDWKE